MVDRIKVAFIVPPLTDILPPQQKSVGIWTYEVARRLARSCDVVVYATKFRPGQEDRTVEGIDLRYVRQTLLDGPLFRALRRAGAYPNVERPLRASSLYFPGYALRVSKQIRSCFCNIAHVQSCPQYLPFIRALSPTTRTVLHTHSEWLAHLDASMVRRRLALADVTLACSDFLTDKLKQLMPEFTGIVRTVHNGVDVERFSGDTNGRPQDGPAKLLFVGRVSPEKGLHVLLDAFSIVLREHPDARLEVVGPEVSAPADLLSGFGDGASRLLSFYEGGSRASYPAYVRARISEMGLEGRVSFAGPVSHSEMPRHYQDAHLLVSPSLHESFGMPVIEAMACRKPVVATRVGGMTETVEDGKTGLLVDPGDAEALAEAILRLLSDPELRRSMGFEGWRRARDLYSWESVVQELLAIYRELLAGGC